QPRRDQQGDSRQEGEAERLKGKKRPCGINSRQLPGDKEGEAEKEQGRPHGPPGRRRHLPHQAQKSAQQPENSQMQDRGGGNRSFHHGSHRGGEQPSEQFVSRGEPQLPRQAGKPSRQLQDDQRQDGKKGRNTGSHPAKPPSVFS